MGALVGYELRKVFSRRVLWLFIAAAAGWVLLSHQWVLKSSAAGYMDGLREVYGQYEGRIMTDTLREEIRAALEENWEHLCGNTDYRYGGISFALQELADRTTVEDQQQSILSIRAALERGAEENGRALTAATRESYEEILRYGYAPPVIHYAEGWAQLRCLLVAGPPLLILLCLCLCPLFSGERAARMDGLFLTAAGRRKAVWAKLLAAAAVALGGTVFLFGIEAAVFLSAYGSDGLSLPVSVLDFDSVNHNIPTVCAVYGKAAAVLLADALAVSAMVAFASALSRRVFSSLLLAAAFVGVQLAMVFLVRTVDWATFLPAWALFDPANLFDQYSRFFTFLGLSAALAGLLPWAGARRFLRPRRA